MPMFRINANLKLILNPETWTCFFKHFKKPALRFLQPFDVQFNLGKKISPNQTRSLSSQSDLFLDNETAKSLPCEASVGANARPFPNHLLTPRRPTAACFFLSMQNICSPPQPKLCWSKIAFKPCRNCMVAHVKRTCWSCVTVSHQQKKQ